MEFQQHACSRSKRFRTPLQARWTGGKKAELAEASSMSATIIWQRHCDMRGAQKVYDIQALIGLLSVPKAEQGIGIAGEKDGRNL